jgi:hypothetical protein
MVGIAGLAVVLFIIMPTIPALPAAYLPTQWSDFAFWENLLTNAAQTAAKGALTVQLRPDIAWNALGWQAAALVITAALCLIKSARTLRTSVQMKPIPTLAIGWATVYSAAIIGAGGAGRAAAWAVHRLRGRACIFNRTVTRAKKLASLYKFKAASLGVESAGLLEKYSDVIIQATSVGLDAEDPGADPLSFYLFSGKDAVYDSIYTPEKTPLLQRAEKAGCKTANGRSMMNYQAYEQFKLFTGETY